MVFSILGYMAHVTHQDVSDIVAPGSGLAFIVYPEVVSRYDSRHPYLGFNILLVESQEAKYGPLSSS